MICIVAVSCLMSFDRHGLAVAASVLAHDVSGMPLTHAFGRDASPGFHGRYESGEDAAEEAG